MERILNRFERLHEARSEPRTEHNFFSVNNHTGRDSYHTYMTGKWHMGDDNGYRPAQRGFEESYALIPGGYAHYNWPDLLNIKDGGEDLTFDFRENDILVQWPVDFYSSKNYTDKMIEYIDKHKNDNKPFFGYLAYTAPHSPLQAPEEYVNRYIGKYAIGWDELRKQRFERQKALGLMPANLKLPELRPKYNSATEKGFRAWTGTPANAQTEAAKKMAVYAAMIDYMDMSIGRVIQRLKDIGEYEDTLIIFMSDNGPEANNLSKTYWAGMDNSGLKYDNSLANIGKMNSWVSPEPEFAVASTTPYYGAKTTVGEGGLRNNFIVSYPREIKGGSRTAAFASVLDVMPTLLNYAEVSYPRTYGGKPILPLNGRDMRRLWKTGTGVVYAELGTVSFEVFGTVNKAFYKGDLKLLCLGDPAWGGAGKQERWKVFYMKDDPLETNDLLERFRGSPAFKTMLNQYQQYQADMGYVSATTGVDNCGTDASTKRSAVPPAEEPRPRSLRELLSDDF